MQGGVNTGEEGQQAAGEDVAGTARVGRGDPRWRTYGMQGRGVVLDSVELVEGGVCGCRNGGGGDGEGDQDWPEKAQLPHLAVWFRESLILAGSRTGWG